MMPFSSGCDISLASNSAIAIILEFNISLNSSAMHCVLLGRCLRVLQRGSLSFVWYLSCPYPAKLAGDISKFFKGLNWA